MKRDSLDEALRRKLHDAEAGLPVPPWAEMQRRMQLHANAHPAERVPLFRSWSRYAAAAVVLLGIGLGVWRVQRTHSWGEKSMAETVALPLPVSGSDSASRTAPAFNDTALNRIMKSARSVRLIDPRSKASTALLASLSDGAGAPSGNSSPSRDNTDNASATGSDMSSLRRDRPQQRADSRLRAQVRANGCASQEARRQEQGLVRLSVCQRFYVFKRTFRLRQLPDAVDSERGFGGYRFHESGKSGF